VAQVQKRKLKTKLPWNDKAGRFAPLKATTLVLVSLPALWLLYRTLFIGLGARPVIEAVHRMGDWTIYLLLITLAVTPARRVFEWGKLIQIRRILGIAALTYILTHFTLYIVDSHFDLVFVANEIVKRIYLTIGFTAILGLVALGVTSTDGMIRRMGGKAWNRLHNLIYPIAVLGLVHYYLQSKADVTQAVLMSGFFFWLMGYRIMAKYGWKQGLVPLLVLAVVSALLTAAVEASWYGLMTGVSVKRVLMANLHFSFTHLWMIRPAWWVLAAGLAVVLAAELRKRLPLGRTMVRAASAA
jgi:methionine sulfoxide reductase heme-binding subunit